MARSDDDKLELVKKLRALAERGEEHERQSAQKMLDKIIAKYDIDEEELTDKEEEHEFSYSGTFERKLLLQVIYKVHDSLEGCYRYTAGKGSRSKFYVKCTKAEAIQISIEFEFYKELWFEEMEFFFSCFVQKHRIFGTSDDDIPGKELSMAEEIRMAMIMESMQDKSPTLRIGGA